MCARPQMIVGAADCLIRFENRVVVHQWLRRFLEQNPEYYIRKQKPRAEAQRAMREREITELDVWDMDETGFRIGSGKAKLVVTMDPNKPLRMIDLENCDYITSVECIGSAGKTIPPMLLISGDNILYKRSHQNDLDGNIVTSTTETDDANDDTAVE